MEKGEVDHYWETGKVRLKRGDFLLIHPGMMHSYSNTSRDAVYYNLIYDSTIPIPMLIMSNLPFLQQIYPVHDSDSEHMDFNGIISHLPDDVLKEILSSLSKITREVNTRRPGHHILITLLFMEIVLTLSRYYPEEKPDDPKWTLNKVIGFMKCHYAERINVETLAKFSGMSASNLFRKFNTLFGIGPAEYLTDLRVRQAVAMLKNRDLTLASIAQECGFCDASHLWKALKRTVHQNPGEIRKNRRIGKALKKCKTISPSSPGLTDYPPSP
jgi:AraC-like DNA-binding protein